MCAWGFCNWVLLHHELKNNISRLVTRWSYLHTFHGVVAMKNVPEDSWSYEHGVHVNKVHSRKSKDLKLDMIISMSTSWSSCRVNVNSTIKLPFYLVDLFSWGTLIVNRWGVFMSFLFITILPVLFIFLCDYICDFGVCFD